jgi:signal transduction histidine kinase
VVAVTRSGDRRIRRSAGRRTRSTEQTLGWLMSLGGAVLGVIALTVSPADRGAYATWWNAGGIALVGGVLVLAVGGLLLPERALRVLWVAVAILGPVLCLLSYAAFTGTADAALAAPPPWVWSLEPVYVCLPLLVLPWGPTVALALFSALTPLLSALLFLGAVPAAVAVQTPIHLGNIAFVLIFLGIRRQLLELRRAERAAYAQEAARAQAAADAGEQRAMARIVHDEVLASLTIAMHGEEAPSGHLRAMARGALSAGAGDAMAAASMEPLTARVAASIIRQAVESAHPDAAITVSAAAVSAPRPAVTAIAAAAAEASRNAARHAAGAPVRARIEIDERGIRTTIADGGPGFDEQRIPQQRAGVRESILGRLDALEGGRAEIVSEPGSGTRVELTWQR